MPPRGSSCVRSRRICMLTAATAILLLIVVGYSLISESELSATGQTPRQRLQLLFRQQRLDAAAAAAADGDQAEAMEEAELLPPVQAQPVHLLSDHIPARIPPNDRAILVTGGAGFVGMNVVAQLARDKHAHTIVAIDNFAHPAVSDKWNARTLMQDRAFNISRMHGVVVVDGDICNRPFLARLFDRYRFTDVLHLADARAGRHSSNHTDVTVRANIDCFVSLLETMKMFLHPKESLSSSPDSGSNVHRLPRLIFASSADVYGLNDASSGPSASWARVDRPHSMYSATSKGAEVLAWSYHATTGIPMIGLRLFSVFGAWADASSALSAFARGFLSSSSKVALHSLRAKAGASTTEFPERDFIHISDVSNAVVLAMNADYIDFAVVNLGFGQPRSVRDVAALLAQELVDQLGGKSLNDEITIGPLPRGELARTCADTQDLIMTLEYLPAVSFRAGLQDFVRWFLWYHHVSADRRTLSTEWVTPSPAVGEFIAKLESARAKQQEKSEKMMAATIADAKRARIESDRAHLVALDQARGVPLPLLDGLSTKSFVLVEKLFPQSADMVLLDFAVDRPDELIKACNRYDECLAFTPHDGYLKHQLGDIAAAQHVDPVRDTSTGTYVAAINPCDYDLHQCSPDATCDFLQYGAFKCRCKPGFVGDGIFCFPPAGIRALRASNGEPLPLKPIEYQFHPKMDSPGGDLLLRYALKFTAAGMLMALCDSTPDCQGFNTNGYLKWKMSSEQEFELGFLSARDGTYSIAQSNCEHVGLHCTNGAPCRRRGRDQFYCQCQGSETDCSVPLPLAAPTATTSSEKVAAHDANNDATQARSPIHVIITTDLEHVAGLVPLINSILSNSAEPGRLQIHLVAAPDAVDAISRELFCTALHARIQVQDNPAMVGFRTAAGLRQDESQASITITAFSLTSRQINLIKVYDNKQVFGNLASPANYARFYLADSFTSLDRVIYLDVDVIVQQDIADLWNTLTTTSKPFAALERATSTYGSIFANERVHALFSQQNAKKMDLSAGTFNAGVMILDFVAWRAAQLTTMAEFWMKQQAQSQLWSLGTQPIMLLILHGRWGPFHPKWNVNGLGWKEDMDTWQLDASNAALLHWNGARKPWLPNGLFAERWSPYVLQVCGGRARGVCEHAFAPSTGTPTWSCGCFPPWKSPHCTEQ